jgi:hypothetical protein
VYSYLTSGAERLSIGGISRAFPATSVVVVTGGRCASVAWEPFEEHQEQMVLCPSPGRALAMTSALTHEALAGLQTTSRIRCGPGAFVVPPPSTGSSWASTCRGPDQRIAFHGQRLGAGSLVIDGRTDQVIHTRVTLSFSGAQVGTNPTDYWVSASDGLILREQETVDVTQPVGPLGSVHFVEHMGIRLESGVPSR